MRHVMNDHKYEANGQFDHDNRAKRPGPYQRDVGPHWTHRPASYPAQLPRSAQSADCYFPATVTSTLALKAAGGQSNYEPTFERKQQSANKHSPTCLLPVTTILVPDRSPFTCCSTWQTGLVIGQQARISHASFAHPNLSHNHWRHGVKRKSIKLYSLQRFPNPLKSETPPPDIYGNGNTNWLA